MSTVKLDQVTGYALVRQSPIIKLDQVTAYALVGDKVVDDYLVTAKEHVVRSINSSHRLSLRINDVELGIPSPASGGRYNSVIDVTALPSSGFSGSISLSYLRKGIEDIVYNRDLDIFRYNGLVQTTRDLVPLFNSTFGTKLAPEDVVDEPIPTDRSTVLRASPESIWFEPGTEVDVGVLCPSARDAELLDKAMQWPDLSGQVIYSIDFSSRKAWWPLAQPPGTNVSIGGNNGEIVAIANMINALVDNPNFAANFSPTQSTATRRGIGGCFWTIVSLPSEKYPQANSAKYNRAAVIDPAVNGWTGQSWFTSPLIFHYNV